jgi:hypothetical protein
MATTKIQSGAFPADVVTTAAIDDASVTHAKLHTTMDLSSKTVTLPTLSTLNTSGNVGIGETSPDYRLEVKGTATTNTDIVGFSNSNGSVKHIFGLENVGAGRYSIRDASNNTAVFFSAHDADNSYVNAGNVGIGTTTPSNLLSVEGSASGNFISIINNTHNSNGSGLKVMGGDDANTTAFRVTDYNNNLLVEVQGGGNVGIGPGSTDSLISRVDQGYLSTRINNFNITSGTSAYAFTGVNIYQDTAGAYKYIDSTSSSSIHYWGDAIQFHLAPSGTADATMAPSEKMRLTDGGRLGLGTNSPQNYLHIKDEYDSNTHVSFIKLSHQVADLGGLGENGTFIDFDFIDSNDNDRPQVSIGAEIGNRGEATDTGQPGEGRGAFIVKVSDGATPYNADGSDLVEKFRVNWDGYVNAKAMPIATTEISSTSGTNVTGTGEVVVSASSLSVTKRNVGRSRFLYHIVLSSETDGAVTNTNGFLRLEYKISSLGHTSFTSTNKVITTTSMSDYAGGTGQNTYTLLFTPPDFSRGAGIEMRLTFNKSNAQSVYFNQQSLASQPSGSSNHALGYVMEVPV